MSRVSQNINPPSPPGECVPPAFGGGRTHSLCGEGGWGVNISEDARHSYVLYICKYFVIFLILLYLMNRIQILRSDSERT
jgi:hypothetical protein